MTVVERKKVKQCKEKLETVLGDIYWGDTEIAFDVEYQLFIVTLSVSEVKYLIRVTRQSVDELPENQLLDLVSRKMWME